MFTNVNFFIYFYVLFYFGFFVSRIKLKETWRVIE